jgi:hypothetical protein
MISITMSALVLQISSPVTATPVRAIAIALFALGAVLVIEAIRIFGRPEVPRETITLRADAPA